MKSSIETLVEENVNLKKALNIARIGLEKSQMDYNALKELFQEIKEKYERNKNDNQILAKKYQTLNADKLQQERYYETRIYEFKEIIETKQNEIQDIQQKLIPTLDQDMIRVKLISEMEVPYQEAVGKKDEQIERLNKQLYESQRKLALANLQLRSSKEDYSVKIRDLEEGYKKDVERLNRQLESLSVGTDLREKDKSMIRKMRKDLEEVRILLAKKEEELQNMMRVTDQLRMEKNELLLKNASRKNVDNSDRSLLNVEISKLTQRLRNKDQEIQNLQKQIREEEDKHRATKRKLDERERESDRLRDELEHERVKTKEAEHHSRQLSDTIQELKQNLREKTTQAERMERDLESNRGEYILLVEKMKREKETMEYNYNEMMEEYSQKKRSRRSDDSKEADSLRRENKELLDTINRLRGEIDFLKASASQTSRPTQAPQPTPKPPGNEIEKLKDKVENLKRKLAEANLKIVSLLKQKVKIKQFDVTAVKPTRGQQDYDYSNIHYQTKDAAMVPLVPNIVCEATNLRGRGYSLY